MLLWWTYEDVTLNRTRLEIGCGYIDGSDLESQEGREAQHQPDSWELRGSTILANAIFLLIPITVQANAGFQAQLILLGYISACDV